jgi:putative MATE family efflux protein
MTAPAPDAPPAAPPDAGGGELSAKESAARLFSNRALAMLVAPLIVEQVLVITLGFADIVMVATLGEAAVSAVSLGDSVNVLITGLFGALSTGGAVVCAHYFGAKNRQMISMTAKQLIYATAGISLFMTAAGLLFQRPLLTLIFGAIESGVMEDTARYFFYSLLSYPFIALYSAASALFRAQGNTAVSMCFALLVNVLNIGGNALCLFLLGWGVEGVAIPTLLSRAAAAFGLFALLSRERPYKEKPGISIKGILAVKLELQTIKKILSIGVPNGIENSVFQIGKILVLTLMAGFGTQAVAANATAAKLCELSCIPGIAMGYAMITVVGQALGARSPGAARCLNRRLLCVSYAAIGAATLPLMLFSREVIGFFGLSPGASELARDMFLLHGAAGLLIWPLSFVLPASLRAANDAAFTMAVSFVTMWAVRVGLSYLFARGSGLGALSVWVAMIIDWLVRALVFSVRWRRLGRRFSNREY